MFSLRRFNPQYAYHFIIFIMPIMPRSDHVYHVILALAADRITLPSFAPPRLPRLPR